MYSTILGLTAVHTDMPKGSQKPKSGPGQGPMRRDGTTRETRQLEVCMNTSASGSSSSRKSRPLGPHVSGLFCDYIISPTRGPGWAIGRWMMRLASRASWAIHSRG